VILSVVLMGLDQRMQQLEGLRATLAFVTYPIHYAAQLPSSVINNTANLFHSRKELFDENQRLHEENQKLRGRMLRFYALEEENLRLRGQLGAVLKLGDRVSLAEIEAVDLDPYRQQAAINRGSLAGVFSGQAVVDAKAVMGQVTHVGALSSTILLITDASHSLPVRVLRTGLRTIAVGTGQMDRLDLPYVLPNADIREGDILVTSGLGDHFPPDYPVARIVSVDDSLSGLFGGVTARPMADLGRAQEVMLVWTIDGQKSLPSPGSPEGIAEAAPQNHHRGCNASSPLQSPLPWPWCWPSLTCPTGRRITGPSGY
jgi:rod shape-determining protein MreC